MCGILGYSGTEEGFSHEAIKILFLYNEERGVEATGFFAPESGIFKKALRAKKFVHFIDELKQKQNLFIGHTRYGTTGANTDANAHPFETENFIGIHNGMIYGHEALRISHSLPKHVVDSEVIYNMLEKYVGPNISFDNNAFNILKDVEGAMALAFTPKNNPKRLFLLRRDNPTFIGKSPTGKGIYFSSLEEGLKAIGCKDIESNTPHVLYEYENGEIVGTSKVEQPQTFTYNKSIGRTIYTGMGHGHYYDDPDDVYYDKHFGMTKTPSKKKDKKKNTSSNKLDGGSKKPNGGSKSGNSDYLTFDLMLLITEIKDIPNIQYDECGFELTRTYNVDRGIIIRGHGFKKDLQNRKSGERIAVYEYDVRNKTFLLLTSEPDVYGWGTNIFTPLGSSAGLLSKETFFKRLLMNHRTETLTLKESGEIKKPEHEDGIVINHTNPYPNVLEDDDDGITEEDIDLDDDIEEIDSQLLFAIGRIETAISYAIEYLDSFALENSELEKDRKNTLNNLHDAIKDDVDFLYNFLD